MTVENQAPVRLEFHQSVLVVWIDNPAVNALSQGVRSGLADSIRQAASSPDIKAIVLAGAGRTFPAGADISELGKEPRAPRLSEICDLIEGSSKPIIAALHGTALGGGMELALAAHRRVALSSAKFGFPEVTLGILPGAGGTQRLPRLIGAEQSLRLMITGRPIRAADALTIGLIDEVVEDDLLAAAIEAANDLAASGHRVSTRDKRDGFRDMPAYLAAIATARRAMAASTAPAPGRIIDCVEAAPLLPFEQGLEYERAAFADLLATPESEALRYMFFAERSAGKHLGKIEKSHEIATAIVFGFEEDGVSLSQSLISCGITVYVVEPKEARLELGLEKIAGAFASAVASGRLSTAEKDSNWARLVPISASEVNQPADIVFLTGSYARAQAEPVTFAESDSALVVTMGRVGAARPRGIGLILEPIWPQGRFAEILFSDTTELHLVSALHALLRRMGRVAISVRGKGVSGVMLRAMQAALSRIGQQHGQEAVLELMHRWGMVTQNVDEKAAKRTDPDLLAGHALPVLGAMANAGLQLLGQGIALRPSDIDLAMVLGNGFPRSIGGPMLWASRRGLLVLRVDLLTWAEDAPDVWTPAPLLDDLIRQGVSLEQLNDD